MTMNEDTTVSIASLGEMLGSILHAAGGTFEMEYASGWYLIDHIIETTGPAVTTVLIDSVDSITVTLDPNTFRRFRIA